MQLSLNNYLSLATFFFFLYVFLSKANFNPRRKQEQMHLPDRSRGKKPDVCSDADVARSNTLDASIQTGDGDLILCPPPALIACGGVQTSQQTDNCTIGTWRTGETEPCKEEGDWQPTWMTVGGWVGGCPLVCPLVVRNITIIRTILRFIVDCVRWLTAN